MSQSMVIVIGVILFALATVLLYGIGLKRKMNEEKRLNDIVQELLNMKGLRKDIIAEIVHDIQIDNDNNVHINYKYNIFDELGI